MSEPWKINGKTSKSSGMPSRLGSLPVRGSVLPKEPQSSFRVIVAQVLLHGAPGVEVETQGCF